MIMMCWIIFMLIRNSSAFKLNVQSTDQKVVCSNLMTSRELLLAKHLNKTNKLDNK